MQLLSINEYITKQKMKSIENYLDELFKEFSIDIEFSKHFLDRANDKRNGKQIEPNEIISTFNKLYQKHAKKISNYNSNIEAVIVNLNNDINVPFILKYDKNKNEYELISKTIMRKKEFKTSNNKLKV